MIRFLLRFSFVVAAFVIVSAAYFGSDYLSSSTHRKFTYYSNGQIRTDDRLDQNGRQHGDCVFYWPDGRERFIINYFHGQTGNGLIYEDPRLPESIEHLRILYPDPDDLRRATGRTE